ncbi:MAG: EAL domain-containing protein [Spirochaetales bacterium]|nr:EAL domain-containing protein [Spirochaetales bacterium]
MNEDKMIFASDKSKKRSAKKEVWEILIVDDDKDVHDTTLFALESSEVLGRELMFFHAYSAQEAIDILKGNDRIALILLDAVMETDRAGLDAVKIIREELHRVDVRIVLRTGQPGQVPELETISKYDINDYKSKSELTRSRLLTTVIAALRSWTQIKRLQASRAGLEKIVDASNQFIAEKGLHSFAEGVILQMAGLFNLRPEGIVCVSEDVSSRKPPEDRSENYQVIATAGVYAKFINCHVPQIDNPKIRDSIIASMEGQKTIFNEDNITVFFKEKSGRSYAIYIDSPEPLNSVDHHLLEVFCTNLSLSANNIELVTRLKRQAWEDQVLHIPNMVALLDEIHHSYQKGEAGKSVLLLLDINSFSRINDLLGHEYGDELLQALVEELKKRIEPLSFLARISADIFGIFGSERFLDRAKVKDLSSLEVSVREDRRELSLSVGAAKMVATVDNPSALLHNAFFALKQAKERGEAVYYNEDIGNRTRERIALLNDLKEAFAHNELHLVYQPQIRVEGEDVYSFESLIRWSRKDGTHVSPEKFIPLAEQSGLIIPMGEWILRQSLEDLQKIHGEGFDSMKVAVNVSAIQFSHPRFLEMLDRVLAETKMDPSFLELEITESISIMAVKDILRILEGIQERRISLAVDDFGTGYSSLSSIDRWPVNRIKIDKAFVQQLDSEKNGTSLVDLVIPLGKKLSMNILAEGVETKEQFEHLAKLECSEIQGYFISKPKSLPELMEWLKQRRETL